MGDEVCIDFITDVVNDDYHNTLNVIEEGCVTASGVSESLDAEAPMLYPNPMTDQATLRFSNPTRSAMDLTITDPTGRVVYTARPTGTLHTIDRGSLPAGTYIYTLVGPATPTFTGQLNIQ